MGYISSLPETKVSITFYSKNISVVNGVEQAEAGTEVSTVDGLFWTGSQNLNYLSDKLKTSAEGAIAIDYNSTLAALKDNSWFIVNTKKYRVLHVDNVAEQNELLVILYKRDVSN